MTPPPPLQALAPCTTIWGGNEVVREDPAVERHADAVYCPFSAETFFDSDPDWGVYDSDGALIDAAAYYRGGDYRRLIGQSPQRALPQSLPEAPPATYVYVGAVIPHYGHFLISSLSRLWFVLDGVGRGCKLLAHAHSPPAIWFHTPYMREMLGRLGLTADDFAWFPEPTRIRDLVVPRTSFEEQCFAHLAYGRICRAIGATIPPGESRSLPPAYLSKLRWPGGYQRLANEAAIVPALQEAGVDILYPETMPFEQQVGVFRERRVVMAFASSPLHTAVFAGGRALTIGLTTGQINSNLTLADAVSGQESLYLQPTGGSRDAGPQRGFHRNILLHDAFGIARELAELAWHYQAIRT